MPREGDRNSYWQAKEKEATVGTYKGVRSKLGFFYVDVLWR